jgi:hypothetical protein
MSELSDKEFLKLYMRNRAISKIMNETRVGEVEGIHFDLRHKQISPTEWAMEDYLGGEDPAYLPIRRKESLPFIWFPWYGKFDLTQIRAEVLRGFRAEKEYAENGPPTPREAYDNITDAEYEDAIKEEKRRRFVPTRTWIKDELKSLTPDAIVYSGDRIEVRRAVMNVEDDDEFIPIQDRVHSFIYL